MSSARRAAIGIGVVLALGAAGLVCQRVGDRGRFALAYSTQGAGPEGARAALLATGGRPWAEDLGRIPPRATLIALGGCDHLASRPLSRIEGEHLARWIEAGGTLIVAGAPDYLPASLGVRIVAPPFEECVGSSGLLGILLRAQRSAEEGADGGAPGDVDDGLGDRLARDPAGTAQELAPEEGPPPIVWARGVRGGPLEGAAIGLRRPARVSAEGVHEVLLAIDEDGAPRPAAIRVRRGEGSVIAIASASALQNRDLVDANGAVLLARSIGEGEVLFDEYHLGAGERRSAMRYLAQSGGGPIAIQLGLVALLALWWRGARFGAPVRELEAPRETTASFVGAIGGLFARAGDPRGARAILAREAIARIARHHHQDAHDPERLAALLRARKRDVAADAVLAIARRALPGGEGAVDIVVEARAIDVEVARAIGDDR